HDGRSYTVRPGEFLIVRAGAAVDVELLQPSVGLCLYLENPRAAPPAGPVLRGSDAFSALGGLLRAAGEALARDDTRDLDAASAETRRLLVAAGPAVADLLREIETGAARLDATRPETLSRRLARLEEARAYLHASRRGPVALSEVARVAGMSPFHLARNFRAAFGAGPVTYHEGLRLGLARRLLETGLSPSEVSADLGYSELRAFSRAFKRRFGSPPSLACAQTDEGAAQDGLQEVL
ncbi:MAG TPA: AraC family transcriptional regulator, partial [Caulobacteraceae bacterium]